MGFTGDSDGKESACNAEDPDSIPESGRFPGERNGYLLWYSCLEKSMDRGAWQTTVLWVAKSQAWLSNYYGPLGCSEKAGSSECERKLSSVWAVYGLLIQLSPVNMTSNKTHYFYLDSCFLLHIHFQNLFNKCLLSAHWVMF